MVINFKWSNLVCFAFQENGKDFIPAKPHETEPQPRLHLETPKEQWSLSTAFYTVEN